MCDVSCSLFPVGPSVKRAAKASFPRVSINGSCLLSVLNACNVTDQLVNRYEINFDSDPFNLI